MTGELSLNLSIHRVQEITAGYGSSPTEAVVAVNGMRVTIESPERTMSLTAHVVHPGDPIRIINVLDAVRPAVKPANPDATYPGFLGPPRRPAGPSSTKVLDGVTVLATAPLHRSAGFDLLPDRPDGDAVIDMAGPGAVYTPWSGDTIVVLEFTPDPTCPVVETDRVIRHTLLRTARDLAMASSTLPEAVERLPRSDLDPDLPPIAAVIHVGAEGPLLDTFLNGKSLQAAPPVLVDPIDVVDGGVVDGAFDWAALRNPTASYQTSRLLYRLLRGEGARCAGVILTRAYSTSDRDKRRNAAAAADTAARTGARGAVVTTFQSGNSQTDTMLAIEACEERGLATVGIIAESDDGLTDHVAAADCLVSVGNEDDRVPGWRPQRTIGGATLIGGEDAADGDPLPIRAYLGALSQLGNAYLQAVPS